MKKVLQLAKQYPPYKGGVELVSQMISKSHIDEGDDVTVISFGAEDQDYRGDYGERVLQTNRDLFINSAPLSFKLLFRFRKILKTSNIDILYVHLPNPYMHQLVHIYGKMIKRLGINIVAVYHSDLVNQKIIAPIYNKWFLATSKMYDKIIASSDKLWSSSPVLSKIDKSRKCIIPFCVNSDVEYHQRGKFTGKLLCIGRFVPYKGFDFLIDAIADTGYQLTMIGDGPMRGALEKRASKNIIFAGLVSEEEKKRLLVESDLLVMSSINRAEAYGMVIVEAFKAGLPVVAADINSGVTYLVEDGSRGKIFGIKNKDELLVALNEFNDKSDLLAKCSENVRKFYDQNLDYEIFKKKIIFAVGE